MERSGYHYVFNGFIKISLVLSYLLFVTVPGVTSVLSAVPSSKQYDTHNLDVFLRSEEAKSFFNKFPRNQKATLSSSLYNKRDLGGWDEIFVKNNKVFMSSKPVNVWGRQTCAVEMKHLEGAKFGPTAGRVKNPGPLTQGKRDALSMTNGGKREILPGRLLHQYIEQIFSPDLKRAELHSKLKDYLINEVRKENHELH